MKYVFLLVSTIVLLLSPKAFALDNSQVVIVPEDTEIKDKALEKKLVKLVREHGTLTNTRQVKSYMLAVLCEYPEKPTSAKPSCVLRKVKVSPAE